MSELGSGPPLGDVRCVPFHACPPPAQSRRLIRTDLSIARLEFHDAVEPDCKHPSWRRVPTGFAHAGRNMNEAVMPDNGLKARTALH